MHGHHSLGVVLLTPRHAIPALILFCKTCPCWAAGQEAKGEASPHLGHEFCLFSDLWGAALLAENPSRPGPPLPLELPLKVRDLLGKSMPFPLPKLVKGLPCLCCLVLWSFGLGEWRSPIWATPEWLFIAAIKFGGAVGEAEALLSRGLPRSMHAWSGCGGPREGVCPISHHTHSHSVPWAGDNTHPSLLAWQGWAPRG